MIMKGDSLSAGSTVQNRGVTRPWRRAPSRAARAAELCSSLEEAGCGIRKPCIQGRGGVGPGLLGKPGER